MRKFLWAAIVLVIALWVGNYFFFDEARKGAVEYRTAPVERSSIVATVGATGTINPVTSVQVGAQVTGKIVSLHADFNSVVKAGEIIARIDPALFQARRDQAAANLANARATLAKFQTDLAQRKRELDRMAVLFKREFVSRNDLDVATTAYEGALAQVDVAAAQVKQAQAALDSADLDLKYTVIRAPVNGIVIARNVEVGQTVTSGFTTPDLFLIAMDMTKMQVDTNVSEADVGGIAEGNEVTFVVDAYPAATFHGVVRQIRNAPIMVQNVVTYDVVVEVDNRDLRLKPGMTANVSIQVAKKDNVLTVPNAAFRFTPPKSDTADGKVAVEGSDQAKAADRTARPKPANGGRGDSRKTVWRVGPSDEPEAIVFKPGISDGNLTEILEGEITEGDRVIIGINRPKGERKENALPPGFGAPPKRTSPRERGI